ncbi:MAG: hypothetical protein JOS17DRAFT_795324 [Linnemannia elongata]|nr:MAG: hypothetical protein JOS17DRAFT_795324 [Linnemannia elongata]
MTEEGRAMHLKSPQRSIVILSLIFILTMTTAMAAPTLSEGGGKGEEGPSTRDTNVYDTTLELDQGAIQDGRVNPYSVQSGSSSATAANGE